MVELIVVIGILSLMSASFFMMQSQSRSSQLSMTEKLALQMEARKAADMISTYVCQCSEVVRPALGETTAFLVTKTFTNKIMMFYLVEDKKHASAGYVPKKIMMYQHDYSDPWAPKNHKEIVAWVEDAKFTSVNPQAVIVNIKQKNKEGEFQFITSVRLINSGDLE